MPLSILIAGGAGFIGSNLSEYLLEQGHQVTVLDNFVTGRASNVAHLAENSNFTLIEGDVSSPPALGAFDRIYHLASPASPPGYQRYPVETLLANSTGTRNLLELARGANARFLYASTSEAYGDPLEHPQVETYRGNVSSIGPRSMYDEGKRFGEAMTMAYWRTYGVSARLVRIFNTYGPNSDPMDGRLVPNFITQAIKGEPLTVYAEGKQTRSLCYVSDLVRGLVATMETAEAVGEVINLGNPREHTVLEYANLVIEMTGGGSTIEYGPPAVGDDPQRRQPDITKAQEVLGWTPNVTLEDGLRRTIAYFRKELATSAELLVNAR